MVPFAGRGKREGPQAISSHSPLLKGKPRPRKVTDIPFSDPMGKKVFLLLFSFPERKKENGGRCVSKTFGKGAREPAPFPFNNYGIWEGRKVAQDALLSGAMEGKGGGGCPPAKISERRKGGMPVRLVVHDDTGRPIMGEGGKSIFFLSREGKERDNNLRVISRGKE